MRKCLAYAVATILLLVQWSDASIPSLDLQIVAKYPLWDLSPGPTGAQVGDILFLNSNGLTAIDIHDPLHPNLIGELFDQFGTVGPIISGNLLCQIAGQHLSVYDISDPRSPHRIGTLTNFNPNAIAITGHYLVAADNGITTVDLSDPTHPSIVGRLPIANSSDMLAVFDRFAYESISNAPIAVIDLNDPAQPKQIDSIPVSTAGQPLAVRGNFLYISKNYTNQAVISSEVDVYNIDAPAQPQFASTRLATRGLNNPQQITLLEGGFICSGKFNQPISIISEGALNDSALAGVFSAPLFPAGQFQSTYTVSMLSADKHFAYLNVRGSKSSYFTGAEMWVIDIAMPSKQPPIVQLQSPRISGLDGNKAYLSTYGRFSNGFMVDKFPPLVSIDLANPVATPGVPTNTPSYGVSESSLGGFLVNGSKAAAVANEKALVLYDVSDSHDPVVVSTFVPDGFNTSNPNPYGHSFLVGATNDLFVANLLHPIVWRVTTSDVYHPAVVNRYDLSGPPMSANRIWAMALTQSTLYVAAGSWIGIFDVQGPTNLSLVNVITNAFPPNSLVTTDRMLIATGVPTDGITFYDISDPIHPVVSAEYRDNHAHVAACIDGSYLYAAKEIGIDVFDISALPSLKRVAGDSVTVARGLFSNGNLLVATSLTESSTGLGTTSIFPLFEHVPAYTPFSQTASSDGFRFKLRGIPGTTARVQRSTTLGDWADWTSVTLGTNTISVLDQDATGTNQFYRVVAP